MRTMRFNFIAIIASLCSILLSAGAIAQPMNAIVLDELQNSAFQADLYPSQRTAIVRLTRQLARQMLEAKDGRIAVVRGVSDAADPAANARLVAPLLTTLRAELPQTKVIDADAKDTGDPIVFSVSESDIREPVEAKAATSRAKAPAATPRSGRVTVSVTCADESIYATAQFIEKPWADDWTMFVNADSSRNWIQGRSTSPGTSKDEAIISARKSALRPLATLVLAEMNARAARAGSDTIKVSKQWVDERVMQSLLRPSNDGILIKDTFVQKFDRPYGDVWQAAVLIDASPKNIGDLVISYNQVAEAQFGRKAIGWTAMGGMVVLILLLYGFLNVVTKGYFLWRLRAVALLAAIAGVLIIFAASS